MTSYWLEEEAAPLAARATDGRVDVEIVGGGVTGCACALALAQGGARVRLREARQIASGASGRNGGFALRGGAMAYDVAVERFGRDSARAFWSWTERSLERLASLAGDAFRHTGSLRLAADEAERDGLRAEYEALRADGFEAQWLDELDPPLAGRFQAAVRHPPDGALQPARWVRRLAALAVDAGAELVEGSAVESLADLNGEQVVLATDGYTRGLLPTLDGAIRPTRGQVIATEPLAQRLYPFPHYSRHGYDYWQQTPDLRLVLGGHRDVDLDGEYTSEETTTPQIQEALERFAEELVGSRPRVTHRWAGIWGATADQLPLVGPVPGHERLWVAAGYSGHGNVMGLGCGELVASAILGSSAPELAFFDPARLLQLDPL